MSAEERTVVVAGATGYIGGYVLRALHAQGWRVRALARDPDRLGPARSLCAEIFVAHATVRSSLAGLFDGATAAFSSIGIHHFRRRPTFQKVDLGANLNLLEEAERAGVDRFAFVSVIDGERQREFSPLVNARELVADRLRESRMTAIVLRPTGLFNDMKATFEMARRGKVWLIGSGETRINPIHGADLGELAARLISEGEPAELSVGGPEVLSQREIARLAVAALGRDVRVGHIAPGLLETTGRLLGPFNANACWLLRMFAGLGRRDAVGEPVGHHRLAAFFAELAAENSDGSAANQARAERGPRRIG
jgi:uncharacterized protein YbjT (DUF2867 family)